MNLEWTDEDDADVERWHEEFREKVGPLIFEVEVNRWHEAATRRFREAARQRQRPGSDEG